MPPTPPSTTSSSNGHSPDVAHFRVVRKRNRVPLSCAPCRHRKLKCNRALPCDNCTKRGDTESCSYASLSARKKNNSSSHSSSASPDEMQNRIDRLEGLVLSLMTNGAQSAGPSAAMAAVKSSASVSTSENEGGSVMRAPSESQDIDVDANDDGDDMIKEEGEDSDVEHVVKSLGVMKVDGGKHFFASEAHWYAILGEISEVKNYFTEHKKQYEEATRKVKAQQPEVDKESPGTALLFRTVKPSSKAEILGSFPTKYTADLLIARYFNIYDPALHVIHGFKYQKEYDKHWADPNETPAIWLGLSFAMMSLALQSYSRAGDEPPEYRGRTWEMAGEYRHLTAQCLLLEDLFSGAPYMIETLLLHLHAEYARSKDAEFGVLVLASIIVRQSMRMGYHRDSTPFPTITPFQGEMRRRVWQAVRQADLLFSSQAGLPPIIRPSDTNTELPHNIYDDELFEEMKTIPASRPLTEVTPATYMITKAQLIKIYGKIVEAAQSLKSTPYEEIMNLDQELREWQATMPPEYRMRPFEESAHDKASVVMQRYTLDLLYLRAHCVLHRRFLGPCRQNSRYAYSRRTCIEMSMTMLQHQVTLHKETQAGGYLRGVKWFISSLTTNDYLLAAMIVCLDLYHTSEAERAGRRQSTDALDWTQEKRESMMAAVEQSAAIWEVLRTESVEAFKAHASLSVMLNKLKQHQAMLQAHQSFANAFGAQSHEEDPNVAPEHSAAMTLGMLSGSLTPNAANMYEGAYGGFVAQPGQSSGLTPGYSGSLDPNASLAAVARAPSPFSQFFTNQNMGFQTLDPGSNIDWDAWDSFIQAPGTNMDAANQGWPVNMEILSPFSEQKIELGGQQQGQQQGQQGQQGMVGSGQVFMGVSTPPRPGLM